MDPKLEWFLPDSDNPEGQGPFSTDELIERIKAGKIRVDGFVWGPHLGEQRWTRFFELPDFTAALVPQVRLPIPRKKSRGNAGRTAPQITFSMSEGNYGIENIYRRFPRVPMEADVVVHNQENFSLGRSIDISEKGVFIKIDNPEFFQKGEQVTVTIRNAPGIGTFSVPSVLLRVLQKTGFQGHGLYFLRLSPQIKQKIAQYVVQRLQDLTERNAA